MTTLTRLFALGALVTAAAAPAVAASGLEWQWPQGETRKYRVAADVNLPQVLIFSKDYNKDVRVYDYAVALDVSCSVSRETGTGRELACDITDAQLNAHVAKNDLKIALETLDEWDQKLVDDATVTFFLTTDGRLKDFDLQGVNERNQRIRLIKETMRSVLLRAFVAFDLTLPKNGEAKKPWKQKSDLVFHLPVITGMTGSIQVQSEVVEEEGARVTIDTVGRGTLRMEQQAGAVAALPPDTYDGELRSRAVFDTEHGNLVERSYLAQSQLTPGSGSSIGGVEQVPYVQAVQLTYRADGMPMPMLGPNKAESQ